MLILEMLCTSPYSVLPHREVRGSMNLVTIALFIIEALAFLMAVCYRHQCTKRVEVTLGITISFAALSLIYLVGWMMADTPLFFPVSPVRTIMTVNLGLAAFVAIMSAIRRAVRLA